VAFRVALKSPKLRRSLTKWQQARLDRIVKLLDRNPRLAASVEQSVLHLYERDTGTKVVGAPNWQVILEWLITNGPMIIQFILSLLTLFGETL
jgi:hypothetical protein